jgi:hypothetical protein
MQKNIEKNLTMNIGEKMVENIANDFAKVDIFYYYFKMLQLLIKNPYFYNLL